MDDDGPGRAALGRFLRATGYEVVTFESGEEFLSWIGSRLPDCAVLDLNMPGLTGVDVQKRLRAMDVAVPCVVVTGQDEAGIMESALAAGAAAFMSKLVVGEELVRAISAAMSDRSKAHDQNLPRAAPLRD